MEEGWRRQVEGVMVNPFNRNWEGNCTKMKKKGVENGMKGDIIQKKTLNLQQDFEKLGTDYDRWNTILSSL